jgi:hypothetical protein
MTRIKALLCNRNFIFLFTIADGLLFDYSAQWSRFSVLPCTLKNYGLAGGVALSLLSKEAALPAIILTVLILSTLSG